MWANRENFRKLRSVCETINYELTDSEKMKIFGCVTLKEICSRYTFNEIFESIEVYFTSGGKVYKY